MAQVKLSWTIEGLHDGISISAHNGPDLNEVIAVLPPNTTTYTHEFLLSGLVNEHEPITYIISAFRGDDVKDGTPLVVDLVDSQIPFLEGLEAGDPVIDHFSESVIERVLSTGDGTGDYADYIAYTTLTVEPDVTTALFADFATDYGPAELLAHPQLAELVDSTDPLNLLRSWSFSVSPNRLVLPILGDSEVLQDTHTVSLLNQNETDWQDYLPWQGYVMADQERNVISNKFLIKRDENDINQLYASGWYRPSYQTDEPLPAWVQKDIQLTGLGAVGITPVFVVAYNEGPFMP